MQTINVANEQLQLLPQKCVFYPAQQALLVADMHLGKAAHFKKNGQYAPETIGYDLEKLATALEETKASTCYFLGDVFHSTHNSEWEVFVQFMKDRPTVSFQLIIGNHDILTPELYESSPLVLHPEGYQLGAFQLFHKPTNSAGSFYLAGHIHPAVTLHGDSGATTTLPCFYLEPDHLILPAFGSLTGTATLPITKHTRIFVTDSSTVVEVDPT